MPPFNGSSNNFFANFWVITIPEGSFNMEDSSPSYNGNENICKKSTSVIIPVVLNFLLPTFSQRSSLVSTLATWDTSG